MSLSFNNKLEILKQVLFGPIFVQDYRIKMAGKLFDNVAYQDIQDFMIAYNQSEAVEQRLCAFGGLSAFRSYKRQEPFMPLIEALILGPEEKTKTEIEAAAGKALLTAILSGEMGAVQDLVTAFKVPKKKPTIPVSRIERAASYFQAITDGEPFEIVELKPLTLKLFLIFCAENNVLPTANQLWETSTVGTRQEFDNGLDALGLCLPQNSGNS